MLDRSRLGRAELQKQNHEDVILRVLPVLTEGLAMRHASDLRIGCYMILTVLNSKTQLNEDVLTAMMDLVVSGWDSVSHAGLICLVVLARQRQTVTLPAKTFKALISMEQLSQDLILLKRHYSVEKLALGLVLGLLNRLGKAGDAERLRCVRVLLEANLMAPALVAAALNAMLRLSKGIDPFPRPKDGFNVNSALVDLVLCLADTETVGPTFQLALEEMDPEIRQYGFDLLGSHRALEEVSIVEEDDVEMQDADEASEATRFKELTSQIPARTAFEISLLSHSDSYMFASLSNAFLAACQSPKHLHSFSELPVLRKSLAMTEPLYVSFFIRIWCGHYPILARVAAITMLSDYFKAEMLIADVQMLLPYISHALADSSPIVRRATTELILVLAAAYRAVDDESGGQSKLPTLGKGQIYGQDKKEGDIVWLPWDVAVKFIQDWLVPHLEEFQLEPGQIARCLIDSIGAAAESEVLGNRVPKFKSSLRSTVLAWLCSHAVNTPIYAVRDRLLSVLTCIPKVGHSSTVALLKPLLTATLAQGSKKIQESCEKEHINAPQYADHVMEIANSKDRESVKLLENCTSCSHISGDSLLCIAAFRRLRIIWQHLSAETQVSLARTMLELAAMDPNSDETSRFQQTEALDIFRSAKMSPELLTTLLQDCRSLAINGSQKAAKRRRMVSPSHAPENDIRRTSIVLEAIESSATEAHLPLLGRLFEVLTDLQSYREHSGTELHYLEILAINSILGILEPPPVRLSLTSQDKTSSRLLFADRSDCENRRAS